MNAVLKCTEGSRMPGELYEVMMVVRVGLSLSRSRGEGGQGNGLCSGDIR